MRMRVWMVLLVTVVVSVALAMPATAKMKINVGSTFAPGAPVYKGQEKFKELVEQRSKGEIEVFIHPLGAMGGERDVFEAMSTGGLEMGAMGSLRRRGYEIHAVARNPLGVEPGVVWHGADLLRDGGGAALVATLRPTHLLHLAWFAAPGQFWTARENFAWVRASLELLEAFSRCGGQRAVMAGSCAEYDWSAGTCTEGVTPLEPVTVYGTCKHALQSMLAAFSRQ